MRFYNLLIVSLVLFASVSARADDQKVSVSRDMQYIVATHEVAHAAACLALNPNCQLTRIAVWTEVESGLSGQGTTFFYADSSLSTPHGRFIGAIVYLAGAAAEKAFRNVTSVGDGDDRNQAMSLCQTESRFAKAERQAENLVRANGSAILKLANLIMSQEPQNGVREVSAQLVRETLEHEHLAPLSEEQLAD
jgi:hypothetical protein